MLLYAILWQNKSQNKLHLLPYFVTRETSSSILCVGFANDYVVVYVIIRIWSDYQNKWK